MVIILADVIVVHEHNYCNIIISQANNIIYYNIIIISKDWFCDTIGGHIIIQRYKLKGDNILYEIFLVNFILQIEISTMNKLLIFVLMTLHPKSAFISYSNDYRIT